MDEMMHKLFVMHLNMKQICVLDKSLICPFKKCYNRPIGQCTCDDRILFDVNIVEIGFLS